jgi:SAM-dependent MidA family methyltransferase
MSCLAVLIETIRERGPISVADFMRIALYHPQTGYYAAASRRSGRSGDFFTSVDVGPLFGALVGSQFAEMWRALDPQPVPVDLVEAGAGDARFARDVLDWAAEADTPFYDAIRLTLVEASAAARAAHDSTLGPPRPRLAPSQPDLPDRFTGILFANELLDALPVHIVEMTTGGLREVFVDLDHGRLVTRLDTPSTPALEQHVSALPRALPPGWRAEVGLDAVAWVTRAARALERGFLVLIDYGHPAGALVSDLHPTGTLRAIARHHVVANAGDDRQPAWLEAPGERDLTVHVDLSSTVPPAERAGCVTLGLLDQGAFLLGLEAAVRLLSPEGGGIADLRRRMALKSLVMPGGPGSAHKVLVFAKGTGLPALRALAGRQRLT